MVKSAEHHKKFFTRDERKQITNAIREAELKTSGEICVHLERARGGDVMERAKKAFHKLGMTRTKHRNGVLIYLSLQDHTFAILGDCGIHERVGDSFWNQAASQINEAFLRKDFVGGLVRGIYEIGESLSKHFPREAIDINELPDAIR